MITRFKYKDRAETLEELHLIIGGGFKDSFKRFMSDKCLHEDDYIWVDTNFAEFGLTKESLVNPVAATR